MSIVKLLLKWYEINKRDLPWRRDKDPYKVWISEIILQQTRVSQGTEYYLRFIKKFPNLESLANSKEEEVLNLWQGLGYYNRAINLHKTSQNIHKNLKGFFPQSYEELVKLKGIGDYTASAISSICFDKYNPVVDGNVLRFISRLYGIKDSIDLTVTKKEIKKICNTLIKFSNNPGDFNQALMEFGSLVCSPFPDCKQCPFKNKCIARIENKVDEIPYRTIKKKIKKRYLNYTVFIDNKKRTIIESRKHKDIWYHLYQFPLIETSQKIHDYERSTHLQKHIKKFIHSGDIKFLYQKEIVHHLTHQILMITFFVLDVNSDLKKSINISNLDKHSFPVPINNFIKNFLN